VVGLGGIDSLGGGGVVSLVGFGLISLGFCVILLVCFLDWGGWYVAVFGCVILRVWQIWDVGGGAWEVLSFLGGVCDILLRYLGAGFFCWGGGVGDGGSGLFGLFYLG